MNERKLKILFVASGNNPKFPIAPFIKSQADSLVNEGVDVDFFTITKKGFKGYFSHIAPLKRVLQNNNYDILHAHYTFCGWIARIAKNKLPLVVSYMGSDTYGIVNKQGKRKLKSYPIILQASLLSLFVDAVIVKSQNLKKTVLRKRITTILPNGIDFKTFKPADKKDSLKELRLDPLKRYILFLGNKDDPRKNFKLATDSYNLSRYKSSAVLLTPYPVNPSKVPLLLNGADLLLSTSFLEGSPNIIKEAMACNCPIVATPAGDTKETIGEANLCYVSNYNPENMASKIDAILDSGGRSNGRSRIAHLNNKVIAQKLIKLYLSLLNSN